jgi:hypothetical protein
VGSSHANALTYATWTALKMRGRPDRGKSTRPASRRCQNRWRHLRTGLDVDAQIGGDPGVRYPLGGRQDDPGADDVAVSSISSPTLSRARAVCSSIDN